MLVLGFSMVVALLRGGRLRQPVRGLMFPIVAAILQTPLVRVFPGTDVAAFATVCSYLVALPFYWLNRRSIGMNVLLIGLLLNLTVVALNGGRMPVDYSLSDSVGIVRPQGPLAKHQPIVPETRLPFLGDVLSVRSLKWVGSPGDVLLLVGTFLFMQELMGVPVRLVPSRHRAVT